MNGKTRLTNKGITRRDFVVGAGLAGVLAGCSAGTDDTVEKDAATGFEPALDTDTACSITVAGNYSNFEALEAEFDKFNEIYPNVELAYTKLDDYNGTIGPALEGDDAPDLFFAFSWMEGREAYATLFDKAQNLADPKLGIDLGCVREGLLYVDADGNVPMLPIFSTTYGMLVNEDLFEREGLKVPTTLAEFDEVCAALREAGYPSPLLGYDEPSGLFSCISHPLYCATAAADPAAVESLNALEPAAGEYMRPALEFVSHVVETGAVNLDECKKLEDGYEAMILRFFEGDVPMVAGSGDTVSGTGKREAMSEAFEKNPFEYRFHPVPVTDDGGTFFNTTSIQFAVNADGANLQMADEFLRFLASVEELNAMAQIKRLLTPSVDLSYDGVYAPFGEVDASHTVYAEELGLNDDAGIQERMAAFGVGNGELSIDEAIDAYGTYSL